jgi:hypothetical protein
VDKTHVEKASLRFTIIDPETGGNWWKRNHLPNDVSHVEFNRKKLKLISKIIIHPKSGKKTG